MTTVIQLFPAQSEKIIRLAWRISQAWKLGHSGEELANELFLCRQEAIAHQKSDDVFSTNELSERCLTDQFFAFLDMKLNSRISIRELSELIDHFINGREADIEGFYPEQLL